MQLEQNSRQYSHPGIGVGVSAPGAQHYANFPFGTEFVSHAEEESGRVLCDSIRRRPFDFDYSGSGRKKLNKEFWRDRT